MSLDHQRPRSVACTMAASVMVRESVGVVTSSTPATRWHQRPGRLREARSTASARTPVRPVRGSPAHKRDHKRGQAAKAFHGGPCIPNGPIGRDAAIARETPIAPLGSGGRLSVHVGSHHRRALVHDPPVVPVDAVGDPAGPRGPRQENPTPAGSRAEDFAPAGNTTRLSSDSASRIAPAPPPGCPAPDSAKLRTTATTNATSDPPTTAIRTEPKRRFVHQMLRGRLRSKQPVRSSPSTTLNPRRGHRRC